MKPVFSLRNHGLRDLLARKRAEWDRRKGQVMDLIGHGFKTSFRETNLSGPPHVSSRTGQLARAHTHAVQTTAAAAKLFSGFEGNPGRRARLLEYGGTIVANGRASKCGSGKYLAIPLGAAKTANGYTRQGPCEYSGLVIIPGRKPFTWLLMSSQTAANGQRTLVPLFLLVRSVVVPAKLGFYRAWRAYYEAKARPFIQKEIARLRSLN